MYFLFSFVAASQSGTRRGIHFQYIDEEDTYVEERERNSCNELWARGGIFNQWSVEKTFAGIWIALFWR